MPAHPDRPVPSASEDADVRRLHWSGPVGAAKVLGTLLRTLREERGLRLSDVAPQIRASVSKLSRMERGENTPSRRDVNDLLEIYRVGPEERAHVDVLLERVAAGPFAAEYADITPGWFRRMIGLEVESARIQYWEGGVVPGPLQTRRYALGIIKAGLPRAPLDEIERRVRQRMERTLLLEDSGRVVVALLDESVLHRNTGGPDVMIEQLEHLKMLDARENVFVRILPFTAELTPPPMAFTHLAFEYGGPGDIVYVEGPGIGATYVSKDQEVERYVDLLNTLLMHVTGRAKSLALIDEAIEVHRGRLRGRVGLG
ncbi:helix-turn-helix domain-containing protein [Kitasatospora sp. NPDC091257]|uniref:helix-turn-helix domain-containing protein n=1 Tax=Kitasatospora sp. NPDC091257 TaxID=3364084 RepID=UPI00381A69CF